ncbi:MAG: HD domain-containing protein [Proteobacteria bacterium]|nr:HD domain-containing protein [Pseudomonadota bacterium]
MEGGAQDYLTKESINGQLLAQSIRYAIERKRVEKELREGEDRYRDLIENSLDLICTHDLKGQILSVNQEPLRILGYDKDAILKQKINMRDLLIPKRRAEFDEYLATIRSKGVASGLMVIQTAKGEKRVWEYRNTLRTDGVSEPIVRGMAHDVTERLKKDKEIKDTLAKLRRAIGSIIQAMAATVETRDPYTAGHQRRGADLARAIASEMNRSTDEIDGIRMAGMIHDIGKISVPAEILSKPTKLSEIEFSLIKVHVQAGYDILKEIEFPWPIARIVLEHHERMNGSGYPNGLSGEQVLGESRILAVADVVEAMASHRPYRAALGINLALDEIAKNRGVLYDPEVVDACLLLFREKGYTFGNTGT